MLILAGFGALTLLCTDERFLGGGPTIDSVIRENQREIDRIKANLEYRNESVSKIPGLLETARKLDSAKKELKEHSLKLDILRKHIDSSRTAGNTLTQEIQAYKESYTNAIRNKAKGTTYDKLETRDGSVYEGVTIVGVNDVGMQITHKDGSKRIPFEALSAKLQEEFQFDPEQKAAYLKREQEEQAAQEKDMQDTLAAMKSHEDRKKNAQESSARENKIAAIQMKEARVQSITQEIQSLEQSIMQESSKYISNAPQLRTELNLKRQTLAALRQDIARLRSSL